MAIGPIGPYLPTPPGLKPQLPQPQLPQIGVEQDQGGANAGAGLAAGKQQDGPGAAASAFQKLLGDAVGSIDKLQKTADTNVNKLASGQPVDLHDVTISMEQANLSFQLGMQVRNKLIEAYQEVMRMQV